MPDRQTKNTTALAVIVLAAGEGTRMKSETPKVLHEIAGRPMISHILEVCRQAAPERLCVVVSPGNKAALEPVVEPVSCVVQEKPLGTGDAVKAALQTLDGFEGEVLVLYGDCPLLTESTIEGLRAARQENKAALALAGFYPDDPARYGRLLFNDEGQLMAIVEAKDASPQELNITYCNAGPVLYDAAMLRQILPQVKNENAKGEYYLTDVIHLAHQAGFSCCALEVKAEVALGINTRAELAAAEAIVQDRLRAHVMEAGVTLQAPDTVFLSYDTKLAPDVLVEPHVVFANGVTVESGAVVRSFSHLEGVHVEARATIGPFARLRPGAQIGPEAHIGNFVEIKKATIEAGAKVNHLSYIGDARVGARSNVGAGTITCNYDGFGKYHTDIGSDCFVGSHSCFVAPVALGDGAMTAAGSVVTEPVPGGALVLARAQQQVVEGAAQKFRAKKRALKESQKKD